jgi:hypothetical protein
MTTCARVTTRSHIGHLLRDIALSRSIFEASHLERKLAEGAADVVPSHLGHVCAQEGAEGDHCALAQHL